MPDQVPPSHRPKGRHARCADCADIAVPCLGPNRKPGPQFRKEIHASRQQHPGATVRDIEAILRNAGLGIHAKADQLMDRVVQDTAKSTPFSQSRHGASAVPVGMKDRAFEPRGFEGQFGLPDTGRGYAEGRHPDQVPARPDTGSEFRPREPGHRCSRPPQHMLGQPVEPFNIAKGRDYRGIVQSRTSRVSSTCVVIMTFHASMPALEKAPATIWLPVPPPIPTTTRNSWLRLSSTNPAAARSDASDMATSLSAPESCCPAEPIDASTIAQV